MRATGSGSYWAIGTTALSIDGERAHCSIKPPTAGSGLGNDKRYAPCTLEIKVTHIPAHFILQPIISLKNAARVSSALTSALKYGSDGTPFVDEYHCLRDPAQYLDQRMHDSSTGAQTAIGPALGNRENMENRLNL